jgi:hypothetical protein
VAGGFNGPCTRRRKLTKEQSLLGLGQGQGQGAAGQQGAGPAAGAPQPQLHAPGSGRQSAAGVVAA